MFMSRFIRTDYHAGQIFTPHRRLSSLMIETQIVGELAELMDMKKGIVNEVVQENRADELSAMFKMMMDQKKKELGSHLIHLILTGGHSGLFTAMFFYPTSISLQVMESHASCQN